MTAARLTRAESGSAVVEFVVLAVLLLVPLVYLVLTLARVQAGSYAVSQAAREAGRAYVTAERASGAMPRAQAAARLAFADHDVDDGTLRVGCDGIPCLRAGGRVTTTATVRVPLPFIPTFVRDAVPLSVPIEASHLSTVDRFRNPT
ncbi:MAG: TadE/TadG family type IV pilus assembly protein [Dermatophilaceae bacterium]